MKLVKWPDVSVHGLGHRFKAQPPTNRKHWKDVQTSDTSLQSACHVSK